MVSLLVLLKVNVTPAGSIADLLCQLWCPVVCSAIKGVYIGCVHISLLSGASAPLSTLQNKTAVKFRDNLTAAKSCSAKVVFQESLFCSIQKSDFKMMEPGDNRVFLRAMHPKTPCKAYS